MWLPGCGTQGGSKGLTAPYSGTAWTACLMSNVAVAAISQPETSLDKILSSHALPMTCLQLNCTKGELMAFATGTSLEMVCRCSLDKQSTSFLKASKALQLWDLILPHSWTIAAQHPCPLND